MLMKPGSRELSIIVTRYLVRLPVIDRIKAVKDQAADLLRAIRAEVGDLQASGRTLLANNALLLEATTSLIQVLQQSREESAGLTQEVQEMRQEIRKLSGAFDDRLGSLANEVQALRDFVEAQVAPAHHVDGSESPQEPLISSIAVSDPRGPRPFEPETALMAYLYSFLTDRCAVDVGAHVGDVSEMLLDTGFEVHAFEPNPPLFHRLMERLGHHRAFRAYPWALGEGDGAGTLQIVSDMSGTDWYRDVTLLASLVRHALPSGLVFTDGPEVAVKTLDTLHSAAIIPLRVGLLKIDTEGFDLKVLRGMGSHRYPVVVCEYWDSRMPFGGSKEVHSLEDLVREMRSREYYWHIVFYRVWAREETRFYCNFPRSLKATWGNVFFFQDHDVFSRAREWCSAVFPQTFLTH